ncbi:MAG: phosphomevalonate kinase [Canibacter sp.]
MIKASSPGKLYIAGEYAVVEPGQPAVLVAVDRYLSVELTESSNVGKVFSPEYGHLPMVWKRSARSGLVTLEHHPYDFVAAAISTVEQYREVLGRKPRYFDLRIESQLDDSNGQKFGLGSSGAVVVATIAALNKFYSLSLTKAQRYQLAMLATIQVSPKASGGDVAASTFGGWIAYRSPDRTLLADSLAEHGVAATLESDVWAGCTIEALPTPTTVDLLVGWTGSPASTDALVDHVQHRRPDVNLDYSDFVVSSRDCVERLIESLHQKTSHVTLQSIREARTLLRALGNSAGLNIETEKLTRLCDIAENHGAAAKPSGAGGGDCGIVVADATGNHHELLTEWEQHHVQRLSVDVHPGEEESVVF